VLGVSGPYYGTWNDKTISRHDENVAMFKEAPYNTLEWKYDNENGNECFDKGAYLICDGGYQSWPVFICPFKDQPDGTDILSWSGLIESLRKDVECTFGILKKRFTFLKTAVRMQNQFLIGCDFALAVSCTTSCWNGMVVTIGSFYWRRLTLTSRTLY
jgi:hypothetical protein